MKFQGLIAIALSAVLVGKLSAADPVVSNLTAAQRSETKLAEPPTVHGNGASATVSPTPTPKGLSDSDWSGIRGAYERHRHAIVASPDGTYQARNPGQAWLTRFDARGFTVTPDAGGWSWGLELAGYGEATEVRQDGGKISYFRGDGLTEWFINDGRGLEQGWTLAKRPDHADSTGPLRLHLAIRGSLRPQLSKEGASVAFLNEAGGAVLSYGGLKAWDADGKTLHARFAEGEAGGTELFVMVDDANSRYPITIDPTAQQAYLKASNTGTGDGFGNSVAISGDTVIVGADQEDSNATGVNGNQTDNTATDSGAAYVFVRSGTVWSQQAYLKASNSASGDGFGYPVAISGDTVVVGCTFEDSNATGVNGNQADNSTTDSGAAYVFVRSGTVWSQRAYLKASNTGTGDSFGEHLAVSGDTVIVGASEDSNATGVNGNQADNSATDSGAAYVFVRSGTVWSQRAYLKASNTGSFDVFGSSVAVSGDTVIVGANLEDSNATGINGNQVDDSASASGVVYVFSGFGPYLLTAFADHGSVGGEGVYDPGTTATLTATPDPGYVFTAWSGDASGTANPLAVLMDSDKTITANFTPDTNDDDGDGLTNFQEIVEYGTDPAKPDTDGDGAKDKADDFPLNPAESLDTDRDGTGDNADTDDDGDGYSDEDEINIHHTDPKRADSDGDGLTDPAEIETHRTNPNLADTDSDGLGDGEEFTTYHTAPLNRDTDGDGFLDGYEVYTGKSPLDLSDKPALVAEARTAIEFTFPSALGKTYRIEDSVDLTTWKVVESGIAGNGSVIQRFYTTRGMPMRYFRVEEDGP